jgi:hypothetical protein
MIPPIVAASIRSAIRMFAAKATANRIELAMAFGIAAPARFGQSCLSMNRLPFRLHSVNF